MAQGSSARSGSSMDDILSSIRQIIAESEDRVRSGSKGPATPPANDVRSDARVIDEVPVVDAAADDDDAGETAGLADVLARLDAEIEQRERRERSLDASGARSVPRLNEEDTRVFEMLGNALTQSTSTHAETDDADEAQPKQSLVETLSRNQSQRTDNGASAIDVTPGTARPLTSDTTRASVSRSLAQLEGVIHQHTGEALKDTVEETLKPLLQEWLDDNLPSIVERLVRAEIERLARGEQRGTS